MKKLIVTGLAAAFALGMSSLAMAKPVSDMDLDISGLAQINASWSERQNIDDEIDLARLRLNFSAKPADHVSVYAELEATDNRSGSDGAWGDLMARCAATGCTSSDGIADSSIADLYVDLTYIPEVSARIGQFALPISYELNTDEYDLETINYTLGVGDFGVRDRGIMLFGKPIPEFAWAVFGMNGAGAITGANNDVDDQSSYGLKLDWNPLENLNFKIWGNFQEETGTSGGLVSATGSSSDVDAFGLGANYTYQGFRLMAEYNNKDTERNNAENDVTEWFLHASYIIPETDLQVVARYDKYDTDDGVAATADTDVHVTTVGLNWNFEKNARVQLMHEFVGGDGVNEMDGTDLMLSVRF